MGWMADPERLLVLTQPVIRPIRKDEIVATIPALRRQPWDHVEIAPLQADHGRLHEIDWPSAAAEQERLFDGRLRGEIPRRSRLAYFGFAPIPLAMHLGYRVCAEIPVDVYQRHHERLDWRWAPDGRGKKRSLLKPLALPDHGSTDVGPLVVRVSTAHRIDPRETSEIVPSSLAQVDIALASPGLDALGTRKAVTEVAFAFRRALERLKELFPRRTEIHVFAAVPVGLSFLLGTQINPTVYPEVVTYQYWAKEMPRYRRAIVLAEGGARSSNSVAFRPTQEKAPDVDLSASFLDAPTFDWSSSQCTRLHELLCQAYSEVRDAKAILAASGIPLGDVNTEQPLSSLWREALDVAARGGLLRKLVGRVSSDSRIGGHHARLKTILIPRNDEVTAK